ncbi:MAG: tetratricopeptide repeat protein [Pseudomonadota bacterium]
MSNYIDTIITELRLPGRINSSGILEFDEDSVTADEQANYNAILHEVDGTVDFTGDDAPDAADESIQAAELWERILTDRDRYNDLLEGLATATSQPFEDPFYLSPAIRHYIRDLERHPRRPNSQIEFARRIFSNLIPPNTSFRFNNRSYPAVSQGRTGEPGDPILTGLNILFNGELIAPIREYHGSPLPDELIAPEHAQERVANCLEFSTLIVVLFRAAGFEAYVAREQSTTNLESHAYVLARIGARIYLLDAYPPTNNETTNVAIFAPQPELTREDLINTDRETTSRHYSNEAATLAELERYEEALTMLDMALELDPTNVQALNSQGIIFHRRANQEENAEQRYEYLESAYAAYERVHFFDQDHATAWTQRGLIRSAQAELSNNNSQLLRDAITCYNNAIRLNSQDVQTTRSIHYNMGNAFMTLGNIDAALESYDQTIELDPNYETAWLAKADALFVQENYRAARRNYRYVLTLNKNAGNPINDRANTKIAETSLRIMRQERIEQGLAGIGSEPRDESYLRFQACSCSSPSFHPSTTNLLALFLAF